MKKGMSWGLLSLLFSLSFQSHANFNIPGLDFLTPGSVFECPVFDTWLQHIEDNYTDSQSMRDGCDKAEALNNIVWNAEIGSYSDYRINWRPMVQQAHYELVKTLSVMQRFGGKKDNIEIINQANDFLDKYGHETKYSFAVHYYLLAAVKRSVRPAGNDQRYTLMAIGEHPRQREFLVQPVMEIINGEIVISEEKIPNNEGENRFSPKMYNMSYMSFIEQYDGASLPEANKNLVENVKQWYNESAQIYSQSFLERGDFLLSTNEPFAAAYWYTLLTRRPPMQLANGQVDYTSYDIAVERIALSYLVAAQNFAGIRPDIDFLGRRFESTFNDLLWGLGSDWVRATNRDIGDWLGLDAPYDPNDSSQMTRPEMAEMSFCSAMRVAENAHGDRAASEVSENLRSLLPRLSQKRSELERATGRRIFCN